MKTAMPRSTSPAAVTSSARAAMYTALPLPIGTVESKMTMAMSGRTPMFWECLAPGLETPKKSRYEAGAYRTGDTHGIPSGVGRAERHVAVAVDDGSRHRLALGDLHQATILADLTPNLN